MDVGLQREWMGVSDRKTESETGPARRIAPATWTAIERGQKREIGLQKSIQNPTPMTLQCRDKIKSEILNSSLHHTLTWWHAQLPTNTHQIMPKEKSPARRSSHGLRWAPWWHCWTRAGCVLWDACTHTTLVLGTQCQHVWNVDRFHKSRRIPHKPSVCLTWDDLATGEHSVVVLQSWNI